ncbi:MAG: bifunctional diaminohydroxyphosphoribosylaminopyrimidine deaminase/5-amino-6-(5-phosphoribosylamino)uracil reductase RibD [bacterium]|nr:bifunctional diaminohydroxyphosphoribosylaminopyrimidine deaminase/5-amino-6-(5-phosphoribosylamino)uracil reductase RibD [bacterium]
MKKDELYMKKAIEIAKKAKGNTGVNPLVGCVIVKNNRIISEGFHKGLGYPHAEIMAINSSVEPLAGSTIYVTIEPCNTWGRTPPCVETIEQIAFKRIVIGMNDPNPSVSGKSVRKLRRKSYNVITGVLRDEVMDLNPYFKHYITKKKPYIVLKVALTSDMKLSVPGKKEKYFTCLESRRIVHSERYKADAILAGSKTINSDDPILDCRLFDKKYKPAVIILDFSNKLDYSKRIIRDKKRRKLIFVSCKFRDKLERRDDISYFFIKSKEETWLKIKKQIHSENIISVFIEGGAEVYESALSSCIADEIQVFYSPVYSGGKLKFDLEKALLRGYVLAETRRAGRDFFARYTCSQA